MAAHHDRDRLDNVNAMTSVTYVVLSHRTSSLLVRTSLHTGRRIESQGWGRLRMRTEALFSTGRRTGPLRIVAMLDGRYWHNTEDVMPNGQW